MEKGLQINSLKDGMDKVLGSKEMTSFIYKVLIGILLMSMSCFSSARPKYLKYDPSLEFPYVYSDYSYGGSSKEGIQNADLFVLIEDPEEFKRVFNYFNQFGGGLDINWVTAAGRDHSYLTKATAKKSWSLVPYLIERGINLDHQDYHNATGLMYAAYCGHLATVGRLVLAGADMFLRDKDGDTALESAKYAQQDNYCPEGNYEAVIDYLKKAMEIEDPERVKREQTPPTYTKPVKYAAIAYKEEFPFIRAIVKDQTVSADFEAVQGCNARIQRMNLDGEECKVAAVFSSGQCGAYALSEDNSHWGVGTNEKISNAELEALEMCEVKSGGISCRIDWSDCQGE